MQSISKYLDECIKAMDGNAAKFLRIAQNNDIYIESVKVVWPEREAARMILDHTNAFYVRKDDRPRIGPDKDKPYILCEICVDDALIRSELDTHKELLDIVLHQKGLTFNELRLIPARRGMKKKHPFRGKL